MQDSLVSSPPAHAWLLLIHQLPPKPDYLRVKVRRRLHRIGAMPLRGSVYVLPATEEAREDFQWLGEEIRAEGGEAIVCEARFVQGISDEEVRAMFATREGSAGSAPAPTDRVEPGRTWVTRQDVHVDRMASAWLIRRFIDPGARFKFVAASGCRAEAGELRFDMYEAEYTHEGELCTFQTLLRRFGLGDPGLAAIGEIVRDIDCKDTKYGRSETAGVSAMIGGIAAGTSDDEERLARSGPLFDGLLDHFGPREA
jgi:hypothetical protein